MKKITETAESEEVNTTETPEAVAVLVNLMVKAHTVQLERRLRRIISHAIQDMMPCGASDSSDSD